MAQEDQQVVRLDQGVFRRASEKVLRMTGQVLVHGVRTGHQDSQRRGLFPAGAARLLKGCCDAARVTDQHRCVHAADVDAQFQGVGGNNSFDLAPAQAFLDGTALLGQVAATVTSHLVGVSQDLLLAQVGQPQLHAAPGASENDGLNVLGQQFGCQLGTFQQRAAPDT